MNPVNRTPEHLAGSLASAPDLTTSAQATFRIGKNAVLLSIRYRSAEPGSRLPKAAGQGTMNMRLKSRVNQEEERGRVEDDTRGDGLAAAPWSARC